MTGLGVRSSSYGSLEKTGLNGVVLPIQTTTTRTKPSKMQKEREGIVHWIFKFAGRKKVGMLLLFLISAVVFVRVLYVGKGEDGQEVQVPPSLHFNGSSVVNHSNMLPTNEDQNLNIRNISFLGTNVIMTPPPPMHFLGYTLPQGHPCNSFTLPPPPADRKRTGPRPCPVCYLPVEEAIALMPSAPSFSPVLKNLTYIYEEPLNRETEFGGSDFGGYPTLKHRNDSFDIKETMSVHCGFVKGPQPGRNTGFDIDDADLLEMKKCRGIVVASAVFDAFDDVKAPKNISKYSEETVCFYMFVDEETESILKKERGLDENKKVGIWRVVVVHNLPYSDGRRNGKVPKLLVHRMFPNARYSLWIDGKLELVVDPYQILERFLWRKNATFAISIHYRRFDVLVEAEANKAAGKYDNASIDFQVDFYKNEGLTPYSVAKLPIKSDVPEGCVILREHVPISNLFTCLWFNEVDRFTSRDQISFSTVRDKIAAKTNWTVSMFLDCERRNFVVQRYHRAEQERFARQRPPVPEFSPPPPSLPPPVLISSDFPRKMSSGRAVSTTPPRRRGRDRRSGPRGHRKTNLPVRLPDSA
uniref:TOD1/MUCI70 glycosyltransferase-like domain-containing protein n=1 Tax=Noccaea caerulescens TaxID=107243 RepID=A0A1J3IVM8_NOCCA